MARDVELIVDHIGQLCTIPSHEGPQRGRDLGDLGLIADAAIAIQHGEVAAVGRRDAILDAYTGSQTIDVGGRLVTPGLVDPHTHLVWGGDRAEEFEMRLAGATYQEIMAAGGGINRTVRQTRAASIDSLVAAAKARLDGMLHNGTTTVECKTGYGLDVQTEITMLDTIARLNAEHPIDLVPTFLGAHAIPPEYADRPEDYVKLLVTTMIPAVARWKELHWPGILYGDVFCEEGAFTLAQSRRILEAERRAGMRLRVHVDEFASLGGTALAVEMSATTADHLLVTTPADVERLGKSDTIAVLLPATPFGLGIKNTAPARELIAAGTAIAIATDCNPGTAWCESMPMVLALATRQLGLTPAQALAAATVNAAYAVDRGDRIGSLAAGKAADLVIWDVPDYRHLSYRFGSNLAWKVIKAGRVVSPISPVPHTDTLHG
ncbi:MAG TPA: imidazolonepropionase [Aggregatilineales bacterium]|nr:imidazolonepropionase [Aggregatilineales bacterium]